MNRNQSSEMYSFYTAYLKKPISQDVSTDLNSLQKRKRIALFIGSLHGRGIARSFLSIRKHLAKMFDVDLILLSGAQKDYKIVPIPGCEVYVVDQRGSYRWYRVHQGLSALFRYRQIVRNGKYSIVISAGHWPCLFNLLLRQTGKYKAYTSLRVDWRSWIDSQSRFKGLLNKFLSAWYFRRADRIISVTKSAGERLSEELELDRDKVFTLYNPIDVSGIRQRAMEPLSQEDDRIFSANSFNIISVGNLTYQKGIDILLKAFHSVKKMRPDAKLILVGTGPLHGEFAKLSVKLGLQNDVDFLGFKENPYNLMRRADLFVLSSRFEGIANVLIEAMACDVPIVTTDCRAGPEEVMTSFDGTICGYIAPSEHPELLAEILLKAMEEPSERKNKLKIARERVKNFDGVEIGCQWCNLIKS